jgi:hypothetical protein
VLAHFAIAQNELNTESQIEGGQASLPAVNSGTILQINVCQA